ncbi:MAG: TIGR03067 domain-containing protein [Zavarzinella sp.]
MKCFYPKMLCVLSMFFTSCDKQEKSGQSSTTATQPPTNTLQKGNTGDLPPAAKTGNSPANDQINPEMKNDPTELMKFQGKWKMVEVRLGDFVRKPTDIFWTIAENTVTVDEAMRKSQTAKLIIDTASTPFKIDLLGKGQPVDRAIFKFENDQLIISVADEENIPRPTVFDPMSKTAVMFVLEKVKE